MGASAAKLSVSVPSELAQAVRRRVGARGLSGFVARAIAHELEREQLGAQTTLVVPEGASHVAEAPPSEVDQAGGAAGSGSPAASTSVWPGRRADGRTRSASAVSPAKLKRPTRKLAARPKRSS